MNKTRFLVMVVVALAVVGVQAVWLKSPGAYAAIVPVMIAAVMVAEWRLVGSRWIGVRNALLSGIVLVAWWMYCDNTINLGAGLYLLCLLYRYRSFWGTGRNVLSSP